MLRRRLFRDGPTEPPGFASKRVPDEPTSRRLAHRGFEFDCRTVSSADGTWTLAFGRRADGEESRIFRLQAEAVVDEYPDRGPVDGAIAANGTAAIVSDSNPTALGATLEVVGTDGTLAEQEFESNLGRPAIHPAGDAVAVATRPPDAALSLLSIPGGELIGEYEVRDRPLRVLGFHADGDDHYLYAGVRSTDDPHIAMDADGDVVWGSDRYWATRSLRKRLAGVRTRLYQ
jgi:hypothetical protein